MSVGLDLQHQGGPWFWQALRAATAPVLNLGSRAITWLHPEQAQAVLVPNAEKAARDVHLELHVSHFQAWSAINQDDPDLTNLIPKLRAIYEKSIALLNEIRRSAISQEDKAKVVGSFTRIWVDIDNKVSRTSGHSLHLFCGCQVQPMPELKRPPGHFAPAVLKRVRVDRERRVLLTPEQRIVRDDVDNPFFGKRFCLSSHQLGSGHHGVQWAFAERIAAEGGHIYTADGEEIILPLDRVYQSNHRKKWDISTFLLQLLALKAVIFVKSRKWMRAETEYDVVRELLAGGHNRELKWCNGQEQRNVLRYQKIANLMRQHMISCSAEMIVASYTRHIEPIHMIAGEMQIPMALVCPDFDSSISGLLLREVNPRTYMLLCTNIHQNAPGSPIVRETLKRLPEDGVGDIIDVERNTIYGGLPVSKAFLQDFEPELYKIYHIDSRSQVIVSLGGGSTTDSLEMLSMAEHYSEDRSLQLHVIKLCGGNKRAIENNIKAFQDKYGNPPEKVTVERLGVSYTFYNFKVGPHTYSLVGRVDQSVVAEIMALARMPAKNGREGLVIATKTGGGVSREIVAMAVRALVSANPDIIGWEINNRKVLEAMGCATSYRPGNQDQNLLHQMDFLLRQDQTEERLTQIEKLRKAAKDSPELSMDVLRRILTKKPEVPLITRRDSSEKESKL